MSNSESSIMIQAMRKGFLVASIVVLALSVVVSEAQTKHSLHRGIAEMPGEISEVSIEVGPTTNAEASISHNSGVQRGAVDGTTSDESPALKYFTDVVLVNQNGEKMRLYTDLLRGKVVIINAFFATCQGVCLPLTRNLEKVQDALGDRVGRDVNIISITVDPAMDDPASLKEYAKKLHARPGWYFMTGEKENVEFALKKLGQFVSDKQDHLNILIIGNERTGLWKKAFGLARDEELVKVVNSVLNDQPENQK
ncbi:MAG TPA: SCO family protein [Blastocatellia bacterium]|nr:SCO family protein [Blastocatellia bacterium]